MNIKDFIKLKLKDKTIYINPYYYNKDLENFLYSLRNLANERYHVLKDDKVSKVVKVKYQGLNLIIKKANLPSFGKRIKRLFGKSRAKKSLINAIKLYNADIMASYPIAIVENVRFKFFKTESFFISNYIDGASALNFFKTSNREAWSEVAGNIDAMLTKLTANNFVHRDLNLSNIILVNNMPRIIDLDSMKQFNLSIWRKRVQKYDRSRFLENFDELDWGSAPKQLFLNTFNS